MSGMHVTFRDPANPAKLVHAQFATLRSHPELKQLLADCAAADVDENVKLRKLQIEYDRLTSAETVEEAEEAQARIMKARTVADEATAELVQATRRFVVAGFTLAGSTPEQAEELADLVDVEHVPDLKAKCLYGAGCLDFTRPAAGRN